MPQSCALVWFRNDLRVSDNPALAAACASGLPLLCLYLHDESSEGLRPRGAASRWRLDLALQALEREFSRRGGQLHILSGAAEDVLPMVAQKSGATKIFWNRRYGGAEIALDARLKQAFREQGRDVASFNGALLAEPWQVLSKAGDRVQGVHAVLAGLARADRTLAAPARAEAPRLRRVARRRAVAGRPRNTRSCAAKARLGQELSRP